MSWLLWYLKASSYENICTSAKAIFICLHDWCSGLFLYWCVQTIVHKAELSNSNSGLISCHLQCKHNKCGSGRVLFCSVLQFTSRKLCIHVSGSWCVAWFHTTASSVVIPYLSGITILRFKIKWLLLLLSSTTAVIISRRRIGTIVQCYYKLFHCLTCFFVEVHWWLRKGDVNLSVLYIFIYNKHLILVWICLYRFEKNLAILLLLPCKSWAEINLIHCKQIFLCQIHVQEKKKAVFAVAHMALYCMLMSLPVFCIMHLKIENKKPARNIIACYKQCQLWVD